MTHEQYSILKVLFFVKDNIKGCTKLKKLYPDSNFSVKTFISNTGLISFLKSSGILFSTKIKKLLITYDNSAEIVCLLLLNI